MVTMRCAARAAVVAAVVLGVHCPAALAEVRYTLTDLGTLGGSGSYALGINNLGQVVGASSLSGGNDCHAFLYTPGSGMKDLGTFGWTNSWGYGIINAGQIIGDHSTTSDYYHSFLYTPGSAATDLGTLGGTDEMARGINDLGQVVGTARTAGTAGGGFHAFIYSGAAMTDLNGIIDPDSGWLLTNADAINDKGQIVGYGVDPLGHQEAFLLTPIPEPGTIALLALGGAALVRRRRVAPRTDRP